MELTLLLNFADHHRKVWIHCQNFFAPPTHTWGFLPDHVPLHYTAQTSSSAPNWPGPARPSSPHPYTCAPRLG